MPVTSSPSRPEFFLDENGCWNRSCEAHTSVAPVSTRPLNDVFLGGGITSSPFEFENFLNDFADHSSSLTSLPSFDHLLLSSKPDDEWTPSRSLLSPCKRTPLSHISTTNRPDLLADPLASTITTPYHTSSPPRPDIDPIDRKFPDPFARYLHATEDPILRDPTHVSSLFSFQTSPGVYIHQQPLSPLTPMSSLRGTTPQSSPCPSLATSQDTSSSLTWSSSSSTSSEYLDSPCMTRGLYSSWQVPPLPALQLPPSSKKRLLSDDSASRPQLIIPSLRSGRKRKPGSDAGRTHAAKRVRTLSGDDLTSPTCDGDDNICVQSDVAANAPQRRHFPAGLPINSDFEQMYRQHPVSSFVSAGTKGRLSKLAVRSEGTFNTPSSLLDLYTPRWVKGVGITKEGMCPICAEDMSRGGEKTKVWLSMKRSAFNYHMMYKHGISTTGLPFSPPIDFRTVAFPTKNIRQRTTMREGRCHKCKQWTALDTVKKDVDVNVKELFWWKHAARCHGSSHIDGEDGFFVADGVHQRILELMDVSDQSEA